MTLTPELTALAVHPYVADAGLPLTVDGTDGSELTGFVSLQPVTSEGVIEKVDEPTPEVPWELVAVSFSDPDPPEICGFVFTKTLAPD